MIGADVFSAGIMLWEVIFDEKFWGTKAEGELLGALIQGELPKVPTDKSADKELLAICQKALRLSPQERHSSAEEMRLALEAWLATQDKLPLDRLPQDMARWFQEERARVSKQLEELNLHTEGELVLLDMAGTERNSISGQSNPSKPLSSTSSSVHSLNPSALSGLSALTPTPTSTVVVLPPSRLPWLITVVALLVLGGVAWKFVPQGGLWWLRARALPFWSLRG